MALTACLDWDAVYGETDALVEWRFSGTGAPATVRDWAVREPKVELRLSRERDPSKATLTSEGVRLDGALIESGSDGADALGRALLAARAVSFDVWFEVSPDVPPGVIFAAAGSWAPSRQEEPEGSLRLETNDGDLRAKVATTNTTGSGERFFPMAGQTLGEQALVRIARIATGWHHAVVTFSEAEHTVTLFLDGVWRAAVDHVRPGLPPPALRWDMGQNLGVGADAHKGAEWSGAIASIRIWDRALAAEDVARLFDRRSP